MMAVCPECGKKHVVTWPELNPFRRGDEYYCSSNCYEVSVNRDMTKIKQVALIRRQRKNMRLKKDGTPAKKPGRKPQKQIEIPAGEFKPAVDLSAPAKKIEKPEGNMTVIATKEPPQVPTVKLDGALRIETPEAGKVEVISKECIGVKPIENGLEFEYRVTGIDTAVGSFIYSKKLGYVDWDPQDGNGPVSMNLEEWKEFMKVFPVAMKVLGVEL